MSIIASLAAATLIVAAPLASVPAAPSSAAVPISAMGGYAESPVIHLAPFQSVGVPAVKCPAGLDLTNHEYHPGSGWRIPKGVELRVGGGGIDASFLAANHWDDYNGVDPNGSSVTNWSVSNNWVQVVVHCA